MPVTVKRMIQIIITSLSMITKRELKIMLFHTHSSSSLHIGWDILYWALNGWDTFKAKDLRLIHSYYRHIQPKTLPGFSTISIHKLC